VLANSDALRSLSVVADYPDFPSSNLGQVGSSKVPCGYLDATKGVDRGVAVARSLWLKIWALIAIPVAVSSRLVFVNCKT
jgi:hypothetical protein